MPLTDPKNLFTHEGRPMAEWLLQLVAEDPAKRKAAYVVVLNRFYFPENFETLTTAEIEAAPGQFQVELRRILRQPDFPSARFAQDLLALNIALHQSWLDKCAAERAREKQLDAAALAKLGDNPGKAAQKRYLKRVCIQFLRECQQIAQEEQHESMTTGMAVSLVIDALGNELLPAAEAIRFMLGTKDRAYLASQIISRMDRAGLEFYGDLIAGLKENDPNYYFPRALGPLLNHAPEKVHEILELSADSNLEVRLNAINTLGHATRTAFAKFPEVETRLRDALTKTTNEREWFALAFALGKVATERETVLVLVGALVNNPDDKRAEIITALGNIGKFGDLVLPRLISLLDGFKEYDPDYCYHGEHERVVDALRAFGPAAAAAVPTLIRHIWMKPSQYWTKERTPAERAEPDEEVIKLLGELGPEARETLPHLLEVQKEMNRRYAEESPGNTSDDAEPKDVSLPDDYLEIAIKRIQGEKVP
jgi:hypothetical protein